MNVCSRFVLCLTVCAVELFSAQRALDVVEDECAELRLEVAGAERRIRAQQSALDALQDGLTAARAASAKLAEDSADISDVRALSAVVLLRGVQRKLASAHVMGALMLELEDIVARRATTKTVKTVIGGKKSVLRSLNKQPTFLSILEPTKQVRNTKN